MVVFACEALPFSLLVIRIGNFLELVQAYYYVVRSAPDYCHTQTGSRPCHFVKLEEELVDISWLSISRRLETANQKGGRPMMSLFIRRGVHLHYTSHQRCSSIACDVMTGTELHQKSAYCKGKHVGSTVRRDRARTYHSHLHMSPSSNA